MNWIVHKVVKLTEHNVNNADEVCEHLKVGDSAHMVGEQDSFGPVARFYYCTDCLAVIKEREDAELVLCHDCGEEKPQSEVMAWRWYDFYAPQGDEPLMVCSECRTKPEHLNRVARDKADYEREFGDESTDNDDSDY